MTNYTSVDNGYDDAFNWYVKTVREMVTPAIEACMSVGDPLGPCNQYFDCTYAPENVNSTTQTCPGPEGTGADVWTMYYTLTNATGFYNELYNTYGVNQSWVTFGNPGVNNIERRAECAGGATCSTDNPTVDSRHQQIGFPMAVSSNLINPTNPADIVSAALPNIASLELQLGATYIDMVLGIWNSSYVAPVQAFSVPVFMLSQAVQSMAQVKTIGDNAAAEAKKNLILEILGAVLFVVPFVGEGLGALADVAAISRIGELIGEAGNAALTVAGIVADPSSAPLQILGYFFRPGGARDEESMEAMASEREGMDADDIATLYGEEVKTWDTTLQGIIKDACAKAS